MPNCKSCERSAGAMGNSKDENQYIIMAKVMLDNLPSRFQEYFYKKIEGTQVADELYSQMADWFFQKIGEGIGNEVTLLNLTYYIIETATFQYGDAKESLKNYVTNKRNRKNYIYNSIRKEYLGNPTPDDPMFLHNKCEQYFDLMSVDNDLKPYSSKKEYIDMLFDKITDWKKDKDSYLFDYMFFEKLDSKRKAACFIAEIGTSIFKIINDQFYGRINGSLTSIPSSFLEGLFTLRNESLDLDLVITDDKAVSSKKSVIKNEDGGTVIIDTVYDKHVEDFSGLDTVEKNAMIKKLVEENKLKTSAESLSARDLQVMATIFSSFSAASLAQTSIPLNGRAFVSQTLGKKVVKLREVRQVLKSVDKLASTEINISRRNAKGQIESIGTVSFFDVVYGINTFDEDSSFEYSMNDSGNSSQMLDDSILSGDAWTINIFPTAFSKDTWSDSINAEIYTKQYQQEVGPKAKSYMFLLQRERLLIYPEMSKFFSYGYLKSKIRLDNIRASYVQKEIRDILQTLQDAMIIVDTFEMSNTGVIITFLPFTDLEKDLYKVNQPAALSVAPDDVTIASADE